MLCSAVVHSLSVPPIAVQPASQFAGPLSSPDFSSSSSDTTHRLINVEATPTLPLTHVSHPAFGLKQGKKQKCQHVTITFRNDSIRSATQLGLVTLFSFSSLPALQSNSDSGKTKLKLFFSFCFVFFFFPQIRIVLVCLLFTYNDVCR